MVCALDNYDLSFIYYFSLGVCHCNSVVSVSGEAYFRVLETNACVGSLHPPCVYDGDKISRKVRIITLLLDCCSQQGHTY